jgi:predicted nucleic acid-binding protein
MVLTELLNDFARRGDALRRAAVQLIEGLLDAPEVVVAPQTSEQFHAALTLFSSRPDKCWSQTDCASFIEMNRRGIVEALTHDRHFEQAGFVALLRTSPERAG